jgi:hypothetical protein
MEKHIVKSVAAALSAALILSLGAAGGQDDPLVTLSWLVGDYRRELAAELDAAVSGAADSAFLRLASKIESGTALKPPEGYAYSSASRTAEIFPGQTLSLAQGAIFTLKSGEVSGVISAGDMLDLTDGAAVSGTFSPVRGRLYMLPEGGALSFGSAGVASVAIDGYSRLDGEALDHHPVFADVGARDWFYPAVDYVYRNKLYNGVSETEFAPSVPMTRAMFVTALGRLEGVDISLYRMGEPYAGEDAPDATEVPDTPDTEETGTPGAAPAFPDVPPDAYYAPYVAWAASADVVLGYDDGTFKPDLTVTREQMVSVMYRYAYRRGDDMSVPEGAGEQFPDIGDVSDYASAPVRWAVSHSVLSGSNGKLLPGETATRAQVAQIIKNFMAVLP